MNEIERQILENQKNIMSVLTAIYTGQSNFIKDSDVIDSLDKCYWKTLELLEPKTKEESACDMSDLDRMDSEEYRVK